MRQKSEPLTAVAAAIAGTVTQAHQLASIPVALVEVALIDAKTCAATGGMGTSWWFAEVAAGRAPAPVIRAPRCTRWALTSVREFWMARAAAGVADAAAAAALKTAATKASAAAQAKRRAQQTKVEA